MRILVLTNFYPPAHIGGYELRCREMVDGLRQRGHEVRVLTGRYRAGTLVEESHVARTLHLAWGPPYPPEDLVGLLVAEATDRRALADLIADFKPDVVDVWGMEFASQSLVASLLTSSMPVHLWLEDNWVLDAWSRDALCQVAGVAGRLEMPLSPGNRGLCCLAGSRPPAEKAPASFVATSLAEYYAQAGLVCDKVRVRLAGIDVTRFRSMAAAVPPPPFVIIHVGQLTSSRGQTDLIMAAGDAASDPLCPFPVVVRVVGGGGEAYLAELRRLADERRTDHFRVEFLGELTSERVLEFYAGGHLFVFTSRRPFEGLPRVMVEAMLAGLPIIATNTGGQRDILTDGRWGPLLPPGEPEQLAASILDAMQHYSSWQERAARARLDALRRFDLQACIDFHARDLADAAENKKGSDPFFSSSPPSTDELDSFSQLLGDAADRFAATLDADASPDDAWQLAVVLKRTHRLDASGRLLRRLLAAHADEPVHIRRATFHLAEIAMLSDRWSEAAEHLNACLAVAPDHRKAAFDLDHTRRRILPDHLAGLRRL